MYLGAIYKQFRHNEHEKAVDIFITKCNFCCQAFTILNVRHTIGRNNAMNMTKLSKITSYEAARNAPRDGVRRIWVTGNCRNSASVTYQVSFGL